MEQREGSEKLGKLERSERGSLPKSWTCTDSSRRGKHKIGQQQKVGSAGGVYKKMGADEYYGQIQKSPSKGY